MELQLRLFPAVADRLQPTPLKINHLNSFSLRGSTGINGKLTLGCKIRYAWSDSLDASQLQLKTFSVIGLPLFG